MNVRPLVVRPEEPSVTPLELEEFGALALEVSQLAALKDTLPAVDGLLSLDPLVDLFHLASQYSVDEGPKMKPFKLKRKFVQTFSQL